ncbi:MAG: polysaccharide deacetylase family protein [Sphaerochaetaceae bacterium]|nr:polysaccharide deacetylase family protein [Sphaerochaetaceae bacterium]
MFHYVLKKFNYPHFDYEEFEMVIKRLSRDYKLINIQEFCHLKTGKIPQTKEKYILLTFDDGTRDHYEFVYKILRKYNIPALFFLCSNVFNRKVLSIQLIHSLLANIRIEILYNDLLILLEKYKHSNCIFKLKKSKHDDEKTNVFKRLLQYELPYYIRKAILNELIKKYNISKKFKDYYLSINQIQKMKNNGMDFGLHTENHLNLQKLSYEEQYNEIKKNYDLFIKYDIFKEIKSISYPFGYYNNDTIKILKKLKIDLAFAIESGTISDIYSIQRKDCNVLKRGSI